MASINNRIFLAGDKRNIEQNVAGANITPGMLLQTVASTTATGANPEVSYTSINTVTPFAGSAGGFAANMFAIEDALQGRTVTDNYLKGGSVGSPTDNGHSLGDPVQVIVPYPGAIIMALCLAGSHYTVGMQLIAAGSGNAGLLKPTTGSPSQIIGEVVDDIDLSPSIAVNSLVKVRIW